MPAGPFTRRAQYKPARAGLGLSGLDSVMRKKQKTARQPSSRPGLDRSSCHRERAGLVIRSTRDGAQCRISGLARHLAELPEQEAVDVGQLTVALQRRAADAMPGLLV